MSFIQLVVLNLMISFVEANLYLYYTKDSPSVEFYDCIFHQSFLYCRRPETPIALHRENPTWQCYQHGQRHSFESLRADNISVSTIALQWRSTLEMAERYARYQTKLNNDQEEHLCQCDITPGSFGKFCEYLLPTGTTFDEAVNAIATIRQSNEEEAQVQGDILCYTTLECDFGLLCLDWRDICDGVQQCMFGYDEENCDRLEFNECEPNEYRCMNGMCIPDEYFLDGNYDCMDLTDEKGRFDDRFCAVKQISLECDERVCLSNKWSCGDGQCIDDRLASQKASIASSKCLSQREQYFMCEIHPKKRMWTMSNGKCTSEEDYEDVNINNRTIVNQCLYFIKCALSEGLEKNCPCKPGDLCYNDLENPCPDSLIQYPNGAIIAPYIGLFFDRFHDWHEAVPDLIKINASIKCRGYAVVYQHERNYTTEWNLQQWEREACLAGTRSDNDGYHPSCHHDSRTFNNRSYYFIDVCHKTKECISAYRIRDGFFNCLDQWDERQTLINCSNLTYHRFRCSPDQPTCLFVNSLGDLEIDCENKHDEFWLNTETTLAKMNCHPQSTDDCPLIRSYIETAWTTGENSIVQVNTIKTIPFRAYCDSFWDLSSKSDEDTRRCQRWWKCPENQWQCRSGQCIDPAWVLDGEWDCSDASDEEAIVLSNHSLSPQNIKLIHPFFINENFDDLYASRPFTELCDVRKEFSCYPINFSDPLNNIHHHNRPCISLQKLGDGHIDCLGALDEQNTENFCHRTTMLGPYFKCLSTNTCISYEATCNRRCPNKIDDQILCYGQQRFANCSDPQYDFTCFDGQCAKGQWCDGIKDCPHKEDEYLCDHPSVSSNRLMSTVHRQEKESQINYRKQPFRLPTFPVNTKSAKRIDQSPLTTTATPWVELESSSITYACNRGIGVYLYNGSIVCFCPQQYYGDRCQYYNDRLTLIFHMNFSQSIYTTSNDSTILLKMIVLFLFEGQVLSSYEFHARPFAEMNTFFKKIDHVVYSRSNESLRHKRRRYFNRSNILRQQPYSVRIEAYHIKTEQKAELTAVWQYPIYFDFLPSFRFAKVLYLSLPSPTGNPCTSNPCGTHQECHPLVNEKSSYVCLCSENYRGHDCSQFDPMCSAGFCARNALCKPSYRGRLNGNGLPYCICSRNTYGFQCDLPQDQCNSNPCRNNGTCFQSATPGRSYCACNYLYEGLFCETEKKVIRLSINRSAEHQAALIQYFNIDYSDLRLVLAFQRSYEQLPLSLFYYHNGKTIPEIIVIKLYSASQAYIHLVSVHTAAMSIDGTIEVMRKNRCLHVQTLLNTTEEISPFRYHQLCVKNQTLLCFYDTNYLCICDENHSRAECFEYDHSLDQCSYCMAAGRCIRGNRFRTDDYLCLCPACHSGRFCQFSSQSFSFTLDQLFSADLLSENELVRHTATYLLTVGSAIVFLCGLWNNICALVTFRRRRCRRNGSGEYLYFMSIINQINLGLLTVRLNHLTLNIISRHLPALVNTIFCSLFNYLLTASSRITYWLVSLIAIERAYTTIFISKHWLKRPYIARRLMLVTSIGILLSGAYELVFVTSVSEFNDGKSSICILTFPSHHTAWMYVHQYVTILNALLPFLINLCCMITITSVVVKKKMRLNQSHASKSKSTIKLDGLAFSIRYHTSQGNSLTDQHSFRIQLLREVLRENKDLVTGPAVTLIPQLFTLPFFIASMTLVCQTIETSSMRYLLIMSYFASYIPQLISFVLYISPSSLYSREWHATRLSRCLVRLKQF